MSSTQSISRDSLVATLQLERQAIFDMDTSCAEKDRLWSQRTAELEAFLAADRISHPSYDAAASSLARTTSHNSERKRSFQPSCRSQHLRAAGSNISPQTAGLTVNKQPIRCSRSASNPSVKPLPMTITHNSFTSTMPTALQRSAADAKRVDQDIVFDPGEYIAYKQSTDPIVPTAKRQRLDGIDITTKPSLPASLMADQLGSSTSPLMLTPVSSVSPGLSASSYHLSPYSSNASSFYGGEDMSRQSSSLSSTSMTDEFGMLRVESSGLSSLGDPLPSSFNEQQNEFPLLSDSVVSSMTEKPGSSSFARASPGLEKTNFLQSELTRDMGSGLATRGFSSTFSSLYPDLTSTSDLAGYGMPWQMNLAGEDNSGLADMHRTGSQVSASTNSSASNTASQDKAAARRQKHIANGASQPLLPRALALPDKPNVKPVINEKQPISRLPSQPKTKNPLTCHTCKIPLRGPHELTRHWDNVHAPVKKVWVIVEPGSSPFKPKKGLAICKQCKNHKQYNVYYNAAAHLKRVHFCPSKRGRRPRGEPAPALSLQEKATSPSIDQLKAHGWLKQIQVFNQGPGTVVDGIDSGVSEYDADNDNADAGQDSFDQRATLVPQVYAQSALCSSASSLDLAALPNQTIDPQQEAICMQTLGLQPMPFSFGGEAYNVNGYASSDWPMAKAPMAAPMMEHSLSAPGRMGW